MKQSKRNLHAVLFRSSLAVVLLGLFLGATDGPGRKPARPPSASKTAAAEAYAMWINNWIMPMSKDGVFGDVAIGNITQGAYQTPAAGILFSGGFLLSGYTNGQMWSNGVASASRVEDYSGGSARYGGSGGIFVVDKTDPPFSASWQEWSQAVGMGADFYDGDGDGAYSPVDLNGNGLWDPSEDSPDLLGDQTAWFVITDDELPSRRRYSDVQPQGIDIQYSVFGFRSSGSIGDILFVRYRLINRGTVGDLLDSVYFGLWADADLGGTSAYTDDIVGCDTTLDAGYTWNDGDDPYFGVQAPCYMISFFQGPIAQTGNLTDTAYNVRGQMIGVDTVVGAQNLGLASFVNYVQSDPLRGDPNTKTEARNYLTGHLQRGGILLPCADQYGDVFGSFSCPGADNLIPSNFWYSGDPVTNNGWIYTVPGDMRQMQNVGPFNLEKDKPVDIVAAMIVGRSANAVQSVAKARETATLSKRVYQSNFAGAPAPPVPQVEVRTTENTIELIWDTKDQFDFRDQSTVFDYELRVGGYLVRMFNSNSTADVAGGQANSALIAEYDVEDGIGDVLADNPGSGERTIVYRKGIQLDSTEYSGEDGRIRLVIDRDPFTGAALLKGKPYFISVESYALNRKALVRLDPNKDIYYFPPGVTVPFTANARSILNGQGGGIRPGSDFFTPYLIEQPVSPTTATRSQGAVIVDEIDKNAVTGHDYDVSFFQNTASQKYQMLWKLTDATTGQVKLDSIPDTYRPETDGSSFSFPVVDGVMVRVEGVDPAISDATYSASRPWYTAFDPETDDTGVFYLGRDIDSTFRPAEFRVANAITKFSDARRLEIRFGPTQKAYRYVRSGTLGTAANYIYAAGMPTTGALDTTKNWRKGFVDVPFQVWYRDDSLGVTQQLNAAFMENGPNRATVNAEWDPKMAIKTTKEFIVVLATPYSPDTLFEYTGGNVNGVERWADVLNGWAPPAQWDSTFLSPEKWARAKQKYLGGSMSIGLQRRDSASFFQAGEVFTVPITYPFRDGAVHRFKTAAGGKNLSVEAQQEAFKRVNVFPNPLFAYNANSGYMGYAPDEPVVTFSNLPELVEVRIYNAGGILVRILSERDKDQGIGSPFLEWNLQNNDGLRVASGMYVAIVRSPGIGEKVLKFAIIMPQKQIQQY